MARSKTWQRKESSEGRYHRMVNLRDERDKPTNHCAIPITPLRKIDPITRACREYKVRDYRLLPSAVREEVMIEQALWKLDH